ncbi:unnamed protein product [Soboliphyme baturini]|uniref:Endo/exonuclease/phosphatase domain-containing protein n=1 Tax=Soboliphyme baturini TaxID=241478 RepID=A0A183IUJ1_9BILA|nr:unnamed protein product [Soboliphyme baturini]
MEDQRNDDKGTNQQESLPAVNGGILFNETPISGNLNLRVGKLFYSGVDITKRAQAGVGVLVERNLADRITEWKPVEGTVVIRQLKLQQAKALTMVQVYAANLEGEYDTFLNEVRRAMSKVQNTESLILIGDFNAHAAVDAEKWNGVIANNGKRPQQ